MTVGTETKDPQIGIGLPPLELIENDSLKKCKHCQSSIIPQSASEIYATANQYRPDTPPDSPEPEEILRIGHENIAQMEEYIRSTDEKIARIDAITAFLQKYPHDSNSFATVMERYSQRALHELMRKIEEENIDEGDPMKRFVLLYNFFKGRQEVENDFNILFNAFSPGVYAEEQA